MLILERPSPGRTQRRTTAPSRSADRRTVSSSPVRFMVVHVVRFSAARTDAIVSVTGRVVALDEVPTASHQRKPGITRSCSAASSKFSSGRHSDINRHNRSAKMNMREARRAPSLARDQGDLAAKKTTNRSDPTRDRPIVIDRQFAESGPTAPTRLPFDRFGVRRRLRPQARRRRRRPRWDAGWSLPGDSTAGRIGFGCFLTAPKLQQRRLAPLATTSGEGLGHGRTRRRNASHRERQREARVP